MFFMIGMGIKIVLLKVYHKENVKESNDGF